MFEGISVLRRKCFKKKTCLSEKEFYGERVLKRKWCKEKKCFKEPMV